MALRQILTPERPVYMGAHARCDHGLSDALIIPNKLLKPVVFPTSCLDQQFVNQRQGFDVYAAQSTYTLCSV